MNFDKLLPGFSIFAYKRAIHLLWQTSPQLLVFQVVLQIITAALPVLTLYATKNLFDVILLEGTEYREVLFWMLVLLGVQLISSGMGQLNGFVGGLLQQKLTDKTSTIILEKSIHIPYPYFEDHNYHDSLHLAQSQAIYKLPYLHQLIFSTFNSALSLSLLIGYFFSLISLYAWFILLIAIPLAILKWFSGYMLYRLEAKIIPKERESNYYHNLLTEETYAHEIRTLNFGEALLQRFKDIRSYIYLEKKALQKKLLGYSIGAETAEVLVLFLVLIAIAKQAFFGTLAISLLVVYIQGVQRMQSNLKNFLNSMVQLVQQRIFLNDLFRFLDIPVSRKDQSESVPFPLKDCSMSVENLSFTYSGGHRPVLSHINMQFPQGKVIGIVGANGSGKSTLVKLLAGLYDAEEGNITVGGKPLHVITQDDFRDNSLILFQDFQKYFFTIEDIISLGKIQEKSHDAKLQMALQQSQAKDFIDALEEGVMTKMGRIFKGGQNLSGGQWQKLAVARAFYRDPRIIILDEPTSAMDAITETEVFRQLKTNVLDKVIILITHRLYNLKGADHIYVLDEGKVVQEGSFEQLSEKEGLFRELYQNQSF
ncbi:ABC transporter ATP-binding protein [Shivajiella indica]|uniref:ABC transporter ATP-binding protein n=1 Tax=Shivajiella indica TaxID=872115 RepID=A0ABW5B6T1_9BACT